MLPSLTCLRVSVVLAMIGSCLAFAAEAPAARGKVGGRPYRELAVPRAGHRIVVRDYPGQGPALVLMHGFPDSMHLYDRVVPYLKGRRTITFDFLGWGRSDKPRGYTYTFARQVGDVDAVVRHLHLRKPVLVPHDSSGPAAINWALAHPGNTGGLGLLNTFYDFNSDLYPPQGIALWSGLLDLRQGPGGPAGPDYLAPLRQDLIRNHEFNRQWYFWQVGRFITRTSDRRRLLPRFWREFCCERGSFPAFRSLNRDVVAEVLRNTQRLSELGSLDVPVSVIWGRNDPYLTVGLARRFGAAFPRARIHILDARHYVQVDQPAAVARWLERLPGS